MNENNLINKKDIESVASWLKTDVDNLNIEIEQEDISKFEKSIDEMEKSYSLFPKEEKRTNKIIKLINNGETLLPIYVEKNDTFNFILEGRHRVVAFFKLGFKSIPVARVSKKSKF